MDSGDTDKNMLSGVEEGIDLKLAKSYQPAITCLMKQSMILILFFSMSHAHVGLYSFFVVVGTLLYLDRCFTRELVFDTNACSFFTVVSMLINYNRALMFVHKGQPSAVMQSVGNIAWTVYAISVQVFMCKLTKDQPKGESHQNLMNIRILVTSMFVLIHAHISQETDSEFLVIARVVFFTGLCITWIYQLDVKRLKTYMPEPYSPHVVRFAPILYLSHYGVYLYVLLSVALVVYISWDFGSWVPINSTNSISANKRVSSRSDERNSFDVETDALMEEGNMSPINGSSRDELELRAAMSAAKTGGMASDGPSRSVQRGPVGTVGRTVGSTDSGALKEAQGESDESSDNLLQMLRMAKEKASSTDT